MITSRPSTLEQHAAEVAVTFAKQHNADGGHKDVSATSVTLTGPLYLTGGTADTIASTVTNYAPASSGVSMQTGYTVFRLQASGAISLRGWIPSANRFIGIRNVGSNAITLEHEDTAALADYRFQLPNSTDIVLGQYDGVLLWYDDLSKRWTCFQQ